MVLQSILKQSMERMAAMERKAAMDDNYSADINDMFKLYKAMHYCGR